MQALPHEELPGLKARAEALLDEIKVLLIPKNANDGKTVVLEIRAGTGGDEAVTFFTVERLKEATVVSNQGRGRSARRTVARATRAHARGSGSQRISDSANRQARTRVHATRALSMQAGGRLVGGTARRRRLKDVPSPPPVSRAETSYPPLPPAGVRWRQSRAAGF